VVTACLTRADQIGTKSFAEIPATIWEGSLQSGMSDGEVDDRFDQELQQSRSERRRSKETP
jgi:hypothetical protein